MCGRYRLSRRKQIVEEYFDIVSTMLPDNESYRAIEEFLNLKAQENAASRGISNSQLT
jgi:hypothetical protein